MPTGPTCTAGDECFHCRLAADRAHAALQVMTVTTDLVAFYGKQTDEGLLFTFKTGPNRVIDSPKIKRFRCLADVPDEFRGWFLILK